MDCKKSKGTCECGEWVRCCEPEDVTRIVIPVIGRTKRMRLISVENE